jgi:hypothetical protein
MLFITSPGASVSLAQVYKLSANNPFNQSPKLVKDDSGRIYCFWLADSSSILCEGCVNTPLNNFTLCYRIFQSGAWSSIDTVQGSDNQYYYGYDIDKDATGAVWVARIVGPSVMLFRSLAGRSFVLQSALIDSGITRRPLNIVTIAAIDSNAVWFDYHRDFDEFGSRSLCFYDGQSFIQKVFWRSNPFYYTTADPSRAFKSTQGMVYFLRSGSQYCTATSQPSYAYSELISSISTDSVVISATRQYSVNSLAGAASGHLTYWFYLNQVAATSVPSLDIIDQSNGNVVKRLSNLRFFPTTLSKQGPLLIAATIVDDQIFLKAIKDSTLFRTTILNDPSLFADTGRKSLSIISDTGSVAWLAWQGVLEGQSQIFVARTTLSSEIDTNVVLSIPNPTSQSAGLQFQIAQNYPNPFNPTTTIQYTLPIRTHVRLTIYDILGRQILFLVNAIEQPGLHKVRFDAANLPTGVYYCRMNAGEYNETLKLILLK